MPNSAPQTISLTVTPVADAPHLDLSSSSTGDQTRRHRRGQH